MKIPLEFYEVLRNRINLSDVVRQKVILTRKSGKYVGLCPFHQEKSPSFTVSDSKKFYHCFGCGAHGDAIKFVSTLNGLSYKDSAMKLANDYGIELPKLTKEQERHYEESDEIYNILELALEFFRNSHTPNTINYLAARGIEFKVIEEFDIGFAPSGGKLQKFFESKSIPLMKLVNAGLMGKREDGKIYEIFHDRIIFPIKNVYNKVIAFGGRIIGDGLPKYINSPETIVFKKGETLYGENKAISAAYKKNHTILVEGYLDVIALHKVGYLETLASLGTAVTENHIQKLWRAANEIIICLDGDPAGIRATNKLINTVLPLISYDKKVSFIILPSGKDPDDVITENGLNFFQKLLEERCSLSEMIWHIEYGENDYSNAESKALLEGNLDNRCKLINDKILIKNYSRFFKEQIWNNLIKRRTNTNKKGLSAKINLINAENNFSEIEILEHAFCSMLIKFPLIVENEEAKNFLLTLDFKNSMLSDFRDWLMDNLIANEEFNTKIIEQNVKNTRFYDTFLLLVKPENLFLDKSFNENTDRRLLWELLHKKYYLLSLKQEYASIIKSGSEDAFKKATLYQEEIIKTSNDLQKLNESFTNY